MVADLKFVKTIKSNGRPVTRKISVYKCDFCSSHFERAYRKKVYDQEYHFCNLQCKSSANQKGNILHVKTINTFVEKYGVDNANKIPSKIENTKKTYRDKMGVDHWTQTPEYRKSFSKRCAQK